MYAETHPKSKIVPFLLKLVTYPKSDDKSHTNL